jgi:hypothetical protein
VTRFMRAVGFERKDATIFTILVAIGGAIVLTWIYRLVVGRRGEKKMEDDRSDARVTITICERLRSTTPYSAFAPDSAAESLRRSRA